jgi:serine phosphatase RsbU (regulator of sigma subunit)
VVERGIAEIVNDCAADPRALAGGGVAGSLVCAPLRAKQRTVGAVALGDAAGAVYSAADLQLLNTIALQTASAIESALLCAEMVNAAGDRAQLAALQKELDTARTIQHALVPRTFPPFPERTDFDIHAEMTSALAVGGDFFDFFLIDDEHLGVVIGDVSGKGIPAALYMAVVRTQIKTTALQGLPPKECLLEVNRVLVREKVSAKFATCFYGILNTRSGEFQYCNGAHNPPYLLRASGSVERLPLTGGLPLGVFSRLNYSSASVQLASGDALFLYTDGVPEATTAERDDFTSERLVAALHHSSTLSCQDLIRRVTREVLAFTAGAPQSDDITMLALRLHPSGQTAIPGRCTQSQFVRPLDPVLS